MFSSIKILDVAPQFSLKGFHKDMTVNVDLESLREKWVVLFFYTSDYMTSSVAELQSINAHYKKLAEKNTIILGISIDSAIVHEAFVTSIGGLEFPLLSDSHHTTCIDYNVYDEENAQPFSGTFVIDPLGALAWYCVNNSKVQRKGVDLVKTLEELQN